MLNTIRNHSKSFVVYALFILLILSFVVWGAGDVLTGNVARDAVAHVGDDQIEETEVRDAFNREVNRLRAVFGDRFGQREALAMGFDRSVVQSLVNERLYSMGAMDLGLAISDEVVRQEIQKDPGFKNITGVFDINVYQSVLAQNGFTEQRYVNLISNDIRRGLYLDAIRAGTKPPRTLVNALYRHAAETRTIALVTIDDEKAASSIKAPTEEDLTAFHQANAASFTAPEYRKISYVYLKAQDLASEIDVSDDELQQAYQSQAARFVVEEERTIRQILVQSEAKALEAQKALAEGQDFIKVATELAGMKAQAVELGTISKDRYLPDLADAVFALSKNGITEPLKTPLGWHLVQVTDIKEGSTQTLDDVRDDLTRDIQLSRSIDVLYSLSNTFEDALGGGATLEEAANQVGLNVKSIDAMDAQGFGPDGSKIDALPVEGGFAGVAFATPANQESTLIESGADGYFLLRVDGITESRLKPLTEVREQVIAGWEAEQKASAGDQIANKMLETLKSGRTLDALAKQENMKVTIIEGITRNEADKAPQALVDAIFDVHLNESTKARGDASTLVAQVLAITIPDPAAAADEIESMSNQLASSVEQDLTAMLARSLRDDYPVSINQNALNQLF